MLSEMSNGNIHVVMRCVITRKPLIFFHSRLLTRTPLDSFSYTLWFSKMEGAHNQVLDLYPQCRTLVHTPGWIVRDCKMKSGMWLKNASVRTCSNDPVTTDVCNTRQYTYIHGGRIIVSFTVHRITPLHCPTKMEVVVTKQHGVRDGTMQLII